MHQSGRIFSTSADEPGPTKVGHVRLLGCCSVCFLLVCRSAFAQTPVAIEYESDERCPSEADFAKRLRAKSILRDRGGREDVPRTIRMAVHASTADAFGRLTIVERSGETTTREVAAQTCDQVVDALAFVAALALEPHADPEQPPSPATPTVPLAQPRESPESRPAPCAPWHASAAVLGEFEVGIPPGSQFSFPLLAEVRMAPIEAPSRWAPSLRLGFERGLGASTNTPEGSAQFTWTVGRLDVCSAWAVVPTVTVGGCLGGDAGQVDATGNIAHAASRQRIWVAFGGLVRERSDGLRPVFVEVDGGVFVTAYRDQFVFSAPLPSGQETAIYTVPPVGARFGAGVGITFW